MNKPLRNPDSVVRASQASPDRATHEQSQQAVSALRVGIPDAVELCDSHVQLAIKTFRNCGFDLTAMQYPRTHDALVALKRFNGLPANASVPFAWRYFPNTYMRDNWERYYD